MHIKVSGATNAKLAADLTEAAQFYGKILLHGKTFNNISLDIECRRDGKDLGACTDEEDKKFSRYFTIEIRDPGYNEFSHDTSPFKILAHEMVHLKQYATGELRSGVVRAIRSPRGVIKMVSGSSWYGEIWEPNSKQHPYFDSPWEVEAFGREVGLYHRWFNYKG